MTNKGNHYLETSVKKKAYDDNAIKWGKPSYFEGSLSSICPNNKVIGEHPLNFTKALLDVFFHFPKWKDLFMS